MDYPSVSVIIPAYNEEKFIERCIKNLLKQTVLPEEIIVVNNNCTDKTVQLAKLFPVKIVSENKQGITFARNKGFDAAKSDILARCDADSYVSGNWIKEIKTMFSSQNIDALTGPLIYYNLPPIAKIFIGLYTNSMKYFLQGNDVLIGPNMCITKILWNKIRDRVCLDNNKVHEDIDLTIHILQARGIIYNDNNLVVHSSARRIIQHPLSFFLEYPIRVYTTFSKHF